MSYTAKVIQDKMTRKKDIRNAMKDDKTVMVTTNEGNEGIVKETRNNDILIEFGLVSKAVEYDDIEDMHTF